MLFAGPAAAQGVFDVDVVENARHDEINQVFNRRGLVVESRRGGNDGGSSPCELHQILKVDQRERRFARHHNQRATFFEHNVCGTLHE